MLKKILQSATHLFYPHNCVGCGTDILGNDELLCVKCLYNLPYTTFEKYEDNNVEKIFRGRIQIETAVAGYYFAKGEIIQTLVHDFKYNANKSIGFFLSQLMAKRMIETDRFKDIDCLVPLPLFADKEFKRGFNQAKIICDGIGDVLKLPIIEKNVLRQKFTDTQTKKNRLERWKNVADSFKISNPNVFVGKHVALVDDVVTTGATLEACAQKIKEIPETKVSIFTLTIASK